MTIYDIDNLSFTVLNELVITDHKALSFEFLDIGKEN